MRQKKLAVLVSLLFIFSCSDNNNRNNSYAQIAIQFRAALNLNDIDTLSSLTQLPFTAIEQQWDSVSDGIGFVLGGRKVTYIEKKEQLIPFFRNIVPRISIEGQQEFFISADEYDNLRIELADSINDWRSLKTYLFKRNEADVEHIILIGIQARSHKIKALYIN